MAAVRAVLTGDHVPEGAGQDPRRGRARQGAGHLARPGQGANRRLPEQYEQAVASAKQKAEAAAVTAKSAATQGAFYAAIALVLGALAAFFGGRLGAPKPVTLVGAYDARRA